MATDDVTKMKDKDGGSELSGAKDKDSQQASSINSVTALGSHPIFQRRFWAETRRARKALKRAKKRSPQEYQQERSKLLLKVTPSTWKSKSARAKTAFPVEKLKKRLQYSSPNHVRVTTEAAVALAAGLDYAVSELLDVACKATDLKKQGCIQPRHIKLGVPQDESLAQLFKNVTIPQGGVVPHFHPELAMGYSKAKKTQPMQPDDFSDIMDKAPSPATASGKHKSPSSYISNSDKGKSPLDDKEKSKDKDKGKSPAESVRSVRARK